ncbi:hypothetical protein E2C01_081458 [Portunus trituberculatus]|uniref:Uncharacterized protein n=1 Tax=Portunus trituberculatus TaxID=210409 RepID=A0A5B7IWE7_PORTR|nr:hypothetical protein [Portunus trituberculatus]
MTLQSESAEREPTEQLCRPKNQPTKCERRAAVLTDRQARVATREHHTEGTASGRTLTICLGNAREKRKPSVKVFLTFFFFRLKNNDLHFLFSLLIYVSCPSVTGHLSKNFLSHPSTTESILGAKVGHSTARHLKNSCNDVTKVYFKVEVRHEKQTSCCFILPVQFPVFTLRRFSLKRSIYCSYCDIHAFSSVCITFKDNKDYKLSWIVALINEALESTNDFHCIRLIGVGIKP